MNTHETADRYAYYVLGILVCAYILNFVDRTIVAILLEPIKHDLAVSDTAMGVLSGLAFAVSYSLLSFPVARYADRFNRRNVMVFAITLWSVMSSACGLAQGFWTLLLGRVGVGFGEAAGTSPAYSIISDYFPRRQRPWAFGIYACSIYIGITLSLLVGASLAAQFGWRATFLILGPPGLVLALVTLTTVAEPPRGRFDPPATAKSETVAKTIAFLRSQRAYLCAVAGLTVMSVNQAGIAAWLPTFLIRVHAMPVISVGLTLGLIIGLFGVVGSLVGGWIGSKAARWRGSRQVLVPALACLLSLPFFLLCFLAENISFALAAYALAVLISGMHLGPAFALTQNLVRPSMRSVAVALALVLTTLAGQGIGPVVAGMLNDTLTPAYGVFAIRYSLCATAIFSLLAAAIFWFGGRYAVVDLARVRGEA
jgi:predicted MFS family arabinose efflux permease